MGSPRSDQVRAWLGEAGAGGVRLERGSVRLEIGAVELESGAVEGSY